MIVSDTTGFLSSSRHLFQKIAELQDIENLPEFEGMTVDI